METKRKLRWTAGFIFLLLLAEARIDEQQRRNAVNGKCRAAEHAHAQAGRRCGR